MNPRALRLLACGTAATVSLLFPQRTRAGEKVVLSPMAVVASVRDNATASKAGLKSGDRITELNGQRAPSLEELLAYRFDWGDARDTALKLKRDGGDIKAVLPPWDWGLDLRPDLSEDAAKRFGEAKEQIKKDETSDTGRKSWEALAEEAEKTGSSQAGFWMRVELGKALIQKRRWKEAAEVLDLVEKGAGPKSFWALSAALLAGDALEKAGEAHLAADAFARARDRAIESGAGMRLAGALGAFCRFEWHQGRIPEARALAQEALAIQERLAPQSLAVALTINRLGVMDWEEGRLAAAKENFLKSLVARERLAPDSLGVADSLNNVGAVAKDQGDLAAAEQFYIESLAIRNRLAPESLSVAESLNNLGAVAKVQGDLEGAKEFYLKSLGIRERLAPQGYDVAASFNNLGALAMRQGDLASASEYLGKALAIKEHLAPDSLDVAVSLINVGTVSCELGNLAGAKEALLRAQAIRERLAPGSLDVGIILFNLGEVALKQGDLAGANGLFRKSLEIYERLAPSSLEEAECLQRLAESARASGDLPRCAELSARAVDALEAQRGKAGGESAKTSFSAAHEDLYSDLIAAYMDTKRPELALETLERSRGRALLEILSSRVIDHKGEVPEALLDRQRDLARQRKALYDGLSRADANTDPKDIDSWRSGLLMLPQKEDALAEEIRKASSRLAALEYPKPLCYGAIVDVLEPDTLLVAFAVAEKETVLFSLFKGGTGPARLTAKRLSVGRKEIEDRARVLRALLGPEAATGPDPRAWEKQARSLYEMLLAPVSKEIGASRRILIMPDGPLHSLPFAALLPDGKKLPKGLKREPLGLQRSIAIEASMTVYAELKARGAKTAGTAKISWIGFGDPVYASTQKEGEPRGEPGRSRTRGDDLGPLPGTRKEIETIAALFGSKGRALLGAEATEAAVRTLPQEAPYLHFACHGLVDQAFPMSSALALSVPSSEGKKDVAGIGDNKKDGLLQAWEIIQDVKLDSDCVVLSACDTGGGKILGGEGIIGLTRAFIYAGARSAVISLWTISDESTATLMGTFYREVLAGAPRDVALQRAQASLARSTRYAHPFYWAAFQLHGRPE